MLAAAMRSSCSCASVLSVVVAMCVGAIAGATPPVPETDPIDVSAPIDETDPAAQVSTVPAERFARPAEDLPSVLDEEPGVRVTRLGGLGAFTSLSIRGSTPAQVRFYLDGIPLERADGGPVDLGLLPVGPLANVLVVRGALPIRYGGSAIGGLVDARPRVPVGLEAKIGAGGGSFGTRLARGWVGYGGESWDLAAGVDYLGSEGDFEFAHDGGTAFDDSDDTEQTRQNNAFDHVSALARGGARVAPDVRLEALHWTRWRAGGIPGLALFETEEAHLETLGTLTALRTRWHTREGLSSSELDATVYVSTEATRFEDPLAEVGLGADAVDDAVLAVGTQLSGSWTVPLDDEGGVLWIPNAALTWRHESLDGTRAGTDLLDPVRHFASVGFESEWWFEEPGVALLPAARYELAWSDATDESASDEAVTYRLGFAWHLTPDVVFRTNGSRSIRFPTLFELFGDRGYVRGNPTLRPESAWTVDASLTHVARWLPTPHSLRVSLSGFATWSTDLIQFVQTAQNVTVAENVDSARVAGIELASSADLWSHLRIRGALTWLDSENTGDIVARQGKRLPLRPEWQVYVRVAGYTAVGSVLSELGGAVEIDYTAGNFLDHANLVAVPERVLVGADAWAALFDGQLRATLSFRNVTSSSVQDLAGYPLPGFTAMAGLEWSLKSHPESNSAPSSGSSP